MLLAMEEPAELARRAEDSPQLPAAACERVSGYGVMGLPQRGIFAIGRIFLTLVPTGAAP